MPAYDFICQDCEHTFELVMSMSAYCLPSCCPKCNKQSVARVYTEPTTNIIRGDHQITVGELAERNRDRYSDDQKIALHKKHNEYRENPPELNPRIIHDHRPKQRKNRKNGNH